MMGGCRELLLLQILLMLVISTMWSSDAFLYAEKMNSGGPRVKRSMFYNGSIKPVDPMFIIGRDNISLICRYDVNSSSAELYFERSNYDVIDRKYITILSPTEVKMDIPAVSPNQSGYYNCILNGTNTVVAGTDVRVGSEPEPPKDFSCVSENLESMTCSWCPRNAEPSKFVVWTLEWRVGSLADNCSQEDRTSCSCYLCGKIPERSHKQYQHCLNRRPQFIRTATYNFTVVAKNMLGVAESMFFIEPDKIVKPNPVRYMKYTPVESADPWMESKVNISWAAPDVSHFINLKYKVTYKCKWDNNSKEIIVENEPYQVLDNLYPNTKYDVYVRAKPIQGGFWSDASDLKFFSPETVPLASPTVINYRRKECERSHRCYELIIYWQPTAEKFLGSRLEGYEILWNSSDGVANTTVVAAGLWSHHLKDIVFDTTQSYDIQLRALTLRGQSEPDHFHIPDYEGDLEPVEADGVHLENGDAIKVSIINTQPDVSSVRLFYCQTPKGSRSLQTCESDVNEVPFNGSSMMIDNPGSDYMFTVAAYSASGDNLFGLPPSWICIWKQCGDVGKPGLKQSEETTKTELVLIYDPPECGGGKIHLVSLSIEGPGYQNSTSMEPFKQLVIENLKPSTTYEVTAEALGYQKCDKSLEMKSEKVKENFKTLGSDNDLLRWVLIVISVLALAIIITTLVCCVQKARDKRKKMEQSLATGRQDLLSDISSQTTEDQRNYKIDYFLARQKLPFDEVIDEGVASKDTSDYENDVERNESASCLLNSESGPEYGRVTQPATVPNGVVPNSRVTASTEGVEPREVVNPRMTTAVTDPLLPKTVQEPNSYEKAMVLGGYADYLLIPMGVSEGEKHLSESSDSTSPSSTEESTEYTPCDSKESSEAPIVILPDNSKVPVVALPNGIPRSKSDNSVSSASDASSQGSAPAPVVRTPICLRSGGYPIKSKLKDSEDSDDSSCVSEGITVPRVTIPVGER